MGTEHKPVANVWACAAVSIFLWNPQARSIELRAYSMVNGDQPDVLRSTGAFYALCKYNADRCEGYLTGMADVLLALGNSHIAGGICNAQYDSTNLRRAFEMWVEKHPDKLQDDIAISAQAAFRELWPCA